MAKTIPPVYTFDWLAQADPALYTRLQELRGQPLDLSLLGGVAFLYLGGARLKRGNIVAFGGAGGSAAAVTPRFPAD